MYLDHIHPSSPIFSSINLKYSWLCGLLLESGADFPGTLLLGKTLSLLQYIKIDNSSTARCQTMYPAPLYLLRFALAWACVGFIHAVEIP